MQNLVRRFIKTGMVQSAHDLSEGGLFISALESAMAGNLGFSLHTVEGFRKDGILFGESQGRVLLSVAPQHLEDLLEIAEQSGVPCHVFGEVTEGLITVDGQDFGQVAEWNERYDQALGHLVGKL